jgi:hypothetical protein
MLVFLLDSLRARPLACRQRDAAPGGGEPVAKKKAAKKKKK